VKLAGAALGGHDDAGEPPHSARTSSTAPDFGDGVGPGAVFESSRRCRRSRAGRPDGRRPIGARPGTASRRSR
jgi:hypothetical protein